MRTARLGDVCEFKPSKRLARIGLSEDDPVSFVPMNELGIHQKYFTARDERPLSEVAGSYTYFAEGDVLLAKITPCFENGKLGIARGLTNGVGFGSSEFTVVRPGAEVLPEFVYYFLDRDDIRERGEKVMTGAVGHKRVPQEFVEALEIPLPPLEEQRRIVAVLDEAFAAIAIATTNTEKNLASARELFERCLADVFEAKGADWIVEPLKTNVRFIDYRGKTPPKRETGIRLITAKNVKMGSIQRQPEEFIDPAAYDDWMTRGFPQRGDVLFTTEAPLGNVAQLDTDETVVIGQRLITMQPKQDRLDPTFLKYMLRSAPLQRLIHNEATGATVSGIKAKLLKEIPICYPREMTEQLEIVDRLDALQGHALLLEGQAKAKLQTLENLKKSLLHRAFSGGLSERDPLSA